MKTIFTIMFLIIITISFGQNINSNEIKESKLCSVSEDYKEPERDKQNKKWEKRMRGNFPTLEEIKKHVSIDNDCDTSEVTLLKLSEQMGNGIYIYCVKGNQLTYKRMGTVIMIESENPLKNN